MNATRHALTLPVTDSFPMLHASDADKLDLAHLCLEQAESSLPGSGELVESLRFGLASCHFYLLTGQTLTEFYCRL